MTAAIRRARTAFLWVGVIVPLAVVTVSALVVAIWLPDIPEPAATHWSGDGPDGYGPGWTHLVVLLGVGGGMIIAFALLAWFAHRLPEKGRAAVAAERPQWSITARFLGAVNLGMAGLMSVVALVAVGSQRGLADAADAPDIGYAVLWGFLLLVVLTIVGWFLQPRTPLPDAAASADAVAPLAASTSERVVWIGTATIARTGMSILGGSVLLVCAIAALMLANGAGTEAGWSVAIVLVTCAVLIAAIVTTFAFRVRIGPTGLLVRSLAGWPKIEIPAADVASVRSIQVSPFAEFGGWGVRYALDGRYGVVLRAGEAVEVTRVDGRRFVVTVDDADTAAAVLATAARKEG